MIWKHFFLEISTITSKLHDIKNNKMNLQGRCNDKTPSLKKKKAECRQT